MELPDKGRLQQVTKEEQTLAPQPPFYPAHGYCKRQPKEHEHEEDETGIDCRRDGRVRR